MSKTYTVNCFCVDDMEWADPYDVEATSEAEAKTDIVESWRRKWDQAVSEETMSTGNLLVYVHGRGFMYDIQEQPRKSDDHAQQERNYAKS